MLVIKKFLFSCFYFNLLFLFFFLHCCCYCFKLYLVHFVACYLSVSQGIIFVLGFFDFIAPTACCCCCCANTTALSCVVL